MVFDEPRDVKGTAMLTYSHILEPDEQWMFLPALKRVKRISSVNKSGPFMGSEFAFEDFSGQEVGKYSYLWLRDEACGDRAMPCCRTPSALRTFWLYAFACLDGHARLSDPQSGLL